MRVMVAGATGAVGLRLVRQLLERGHQVIGTSHKPERLPAVKEIGAEALLIDGLERRTVGNAVVSARPDAIVNEMTALATGPDMRRFDESFAVTNRLRTVGTRYLLDAAVANGVGRFVVQSYTGWDNEASGGSIKTEEHPLEANPPRSQRETLAAILEQERMVLGASIDGVVLRYGNLYGPGASDAMIDLIRRRRLPIVGGGRGIWSWLHLEDAASATVAALERAVPGVYNVVDDHPAEVAEWIPYLASLVGAPPPRRVPTWLARLFIGVAGVRWMTQGRGSSNEKAKRELGWTPRYPSWRDGFRDMVGTTEEEEPTTPPRMQARRQPPA
jgi:nucleoside-diphosphate-sugar epimerase